MNDSTTTQPLDWWVTTDSLARNGRKVIGPFQDRDLAMRVRTYAERAEGHTNYWVDSEPRLSDSHRTETG